MLFTRKDFGFRGSKAGKERLSCELEARGLRNKEVLGGKSKVHLPLMRRAYK
jgi:hypothetical protein